MRFALLTSLPRGPEAGSMRLLKAFAALLFAGGLAACASTVGDSLPPSMGGLPTGAPARATEPPAYPAVHDMPPARTNTVLTEDEVKEAEKSLVQVRNRQEQQPEPGAAPAKKKQSK